MLFHNFNGWGWGVRGQVSFDFVQNVWETFDTVSFLNEIFELAKVFWISISMLFENVAILKL